MKVKALVSGSAVVGLLLALGSVAQATPPTADVNITENVADCKVAGDVATGVVWGWTDYLLSLQCDPSSSGPLLEPRIALKPPPGLGLFNIDSAQGWFMYSSSSGVTWISTASTLPSSAYQNSIGAQVMPGWQAVTLPVTVTRSIAQPVLTSSLQVQHMDVTVAVNGAFPSAANAFNLNLANNRGSSPNITYSNVVVTASLGSAWNYNGNGQFSANPSALALSGSYTFSVDLAVVVTGSLPVYHKPDVQFNYGANVGTYGSSSTTAGHLSLALPSGAQAEFTTSGQTQFFYNQSSSGVSVEMPEVADGVGPAAIQSVQLVRGKQLVGGSEVVDLHFEVKGSNIAGATVTTPSGAVINLYPDNYSGSGTWEYSPDTSNSALVVDLDPGTYTITCNSTGGGVTLLPAELAGWIDPDPNPWMTLQSLGDTTNSMPTLTWGTCTDANVNMILVQEENNLFPTYWLPGNTATSQGLANPEGGPLAVGGYAPSVTFAAGSMGTLSNGTSYLFARYIQVGGYFNVEPFNVTTTFSRSTPWVYQNSPVMTQNRNNITLTLTPSNDPGGPESFAGMVQSRFHNGGKLNGAPQSSGPFSWVITGGQAAGGAANAGNTTLDILLRGQSSGLGASATVTVTVRLLGDVNGDGAVSADDLVLLDQKLNGLYTGSLGQGPFDLTGDGAVTTADRVVLNMMINGVTVP